MKKSELRVFRCKRCGELMRTDLEGTAEEIGSRSEDRCPDPKAPGGYWYCSYEELVPKAPDLTTAAQDALCILAVLKITDAEKPYAEVSPALRKQIVDIHDLLFKALLHNGTSPNIF